MTTLTDSTLRNLAVELLRLDDHSENRKNLLGDEAKKYIETMNTWSTESTYQRPMLKCLEFITAEEYQENKNPLTYYYKTLVSMMVSNGGRYLAWDKNSLSITEKQSNFLNKLALKAEQYYFSKTKGGTTNLNLHTFTVISKISGSSNLKTIFHTLRANGKSDKILGLNFTTELTGTKVLRKSLNNPHI